MTFTNITGDVEIGFVAKNASGNWIAVDNFRLSQIGEVEKETVMEEVNRLLEEAEKTNADIVISGIGTRELDLDSLKSQGLT